MWEISTVCGNPHRYDLLLIARCRVGGAHPTLSPKLLQLWYRTSMICGKKQLHVAFYLIL
jgi:hypothetical protein